MHPEVVIRQVGTHRGKHVVFGYDRYLLPELDAYVGVLFCSTGIGMSIASNKFRGVYAARCLTPEDAELSRQINNSNVLCVAVRNGLEVNTRIIDTFMSTPFEGRKIDQLEYITCMELESDPAPSATVRVRSRSA